MFRAYEHYPPFRPSTLKGSLASGASSRIPYADTATNETEYTYDLLGRVLSVTDPRGKVTSYVYNGFGDVIQETSPDRGTWVWYYDKARNVTQQIDGTSVTTNMTYDAADRILTRSYPADSSLDVDYTYDETGHGEGIGRLTSVTDQAGTLSLDYDERGLVTSQERVIGGTTYTTGFTYESAGRYSTVTYPDAGWVINYARDNAGQISGVTAKEPGQSPVNVATSVTYLPFGPVSGFTQGNGLSATFTHDLDYRTTGIRYSSAGGNIYYTSNTWNANNNLTNIVDNVSSTNNQDLTYDVIDRLTYASSGSYTSSSITYDSNSNRLTYGGTSYTIDSSSNRMTAAGGSSITYTSAGNISAIGSDTFAYNKANQMATATVSGTASAYVYDAFGQRLKSTVGAGTPVIQQYGMGGLLLSETQGAAETNYVYLNGLPVAAINTASPALSYIHTNHLGTPQKATNSSQSVVWSGAYQPFGAVTPTTSITQNLRFPGQYADPTNLYYNMFRNYNPALGRYMESDPIGLMGGLNTYNYAANNPYRYIDPLGLDIFATVNDNTSIVGTHAGLFVTTDGRPGDDTIYDPGGSFNPTGTMGSGRTLTGEDADFSSYLTFQLQDGPNVRVYRFKTTPEQDDAIRQRIDEQGGGVGGQCAIFSSGALDGIGPFEKLGKTTTPKGFGKKLSKLSSSNNPNAPATPSTISVSPTPYGPPSMKTEAYGPPAPPKSGGAK